MSSSILPDTEAATAQWVHFHWSNMSNWWHEEGHLAKTASMQQKFHFIWQHVPAFVTRQCTMAKCLEVKTKASSTSYSCCDNCRCFQWQLHAHSRRCDNYRKRSKPAKNYRHLPKIHWKL